MGEKLMAVEKLMTGVKSRYNLVQMMMSALKSKVLLVLHSLLNRLALNTGQPAVC